MFSERIGFHVSELLSLCVRDVWQQGRFVDEVALAKRVVERQTRGRTKGINQPLTRVVVAPLAP